MEAKKILEIKSYLIQMDIVDDQFMYVLSDREMLKFALNGLNLVEQNILLPKDGRSRGFSIHGDYIFLHDYLHLYVLSKHDLRLINHFQLGENNASDVCGVMWYDAPNAYVKIRNGRVYIVDVKTGAVDKHDVTNGSFWSQHLTDNTFYVGTVKGELLEIDRAGLQLIRGKSLGNKNIYSVLLDEGIIYTISQDMSLKAIDAETFEVLRENPKAGLGISKIVGVYEDKIMTVSRGTATMWLKENFRKREEMGLGDNVYILQGVIFACTKDGIYMID